MAVWMALVALVWGTAQFLQAQGRAQNQTPAQPAQTPDSPSPNQTPPAQTTDPNQPDPQQPQEASQPTKLPKLADMQLPTAEELLTKPPVDWLVLNTDEVLVVEPVQPRPDTLAKMQQAIDDAANWPKPTSTAELEERKERFEALHHLKLTLPASSGVENPEYELHMRYVKEIIHHEDLMLRRIDEFVKEGKLREAFEMLFGIERRLPDWPGVEDRRNDILFAEAVQELDAGRSETALVRFEELYARKPQYRGLTDRMGQSVDPLIAAAVQESDFRRAHHFLGRLQAADPAHAVVSKWRTELQSRSAALFDQARDATSRGDHAAAVDLAETAALAWQLTRPIDRDTYARMTNRFQRLKVGVLRLPGDETAYAFPADAEQRRQSLTEAHLFEIDRVDEAPHYRTRFFEEWMPNDLGRETVFTLRQNRLYWETTPVLTATDVVETLAARLDPTDAEFDERLAAYVDSLVVYAPNQFAVHFGRVPLRSEALLRFPVLAGQSARSDADPAAPALLTARFRIERQSDDAVVYRRTIPEPDDAPEFHVAEVVERQYESHARLLQGLFRDEVDFLPRVRHADLPPLREDQRFSVNPYAVPVTHVLQFNPQSKPLENRQLRGALLYAINRPRILKDVLLKEETLTHGRLVSAPWPAASYAYNTLVKPRDYDLNHAYSLAVAASKQFDGTVPELRMICPPDPVIENAAAEIVKQWGLVGIKVQLVTQPADAAGGANWDLVYRTVQMLEPLVELWPFLTFDTRARVSSLEHLPDWLRQELIELDYAGDWNSALKILHRLHRQLSSEIQLIPLWEVDEFYVIRKNIARPPLKGQAAALHPYQGVEQWIVRLAPPAQFATR